MKIFLSWSGDRGRTLALAFRDWLPVILHYAKPWMSDSDIPAGERWATEIGRELQSSYFGIICLTRENVSAPWILFEAGALAKSLSEGSVCPLLFDVEFSDFTGPLTQFQAKKCDRGGIFELILGINLRAGEDAIPEARLRELYEALWPRLESKLRLIPRQSTHPPAKRSTHDVLEDLVETVRSIDWRLGALEQRLQPVRPNTDLPPAEGRSELLVRGLEGNPEVVRVDEVRDHATSQLKRYSMSTMAKAVGVGRESIRAFLSGAPLPEADTDLWAQWYSNELHAGRVHRIEQ